jgi:hypothetical protein
VSSSPPIEFAFHLIHRESETPESRQYCARICLHDLIHLIHEAGPISQVTVDIISTRIG